MKRREARAAGHRRVRAASDADLPSLTVARARRHLERFPDDGPAWRSLGIALTEMARFDEAEEALDTALRLCPPGKLYYIYDQLGHHYKFRGDFERAAAWYRKMIDLDPRDATGFLYLGCSLARQGRLVEAELAHRAAIDCPDGCIDEAYLNLGFVLRAQDRPVEAAECFAHALELDPGYKAAKKALRDVRLTIAEARRDG